MKKSDVILEELLNGRNLCYALGGANFTLVLAIASKSDRASFDTSGIAWAMAGAFAMMTAGTISNLCHARRKIPPMFFLILFPLLVPGVLGFINGLEAMVRPANDNLRFLVVALLFGMILVLRTAVRLVEGGKSIADADGEGAHREV